MPQTPSSTSPWFAATPISRSFATSRDGTRIAFQTWGNPSGPGLLFVHAWANSHLGWAPILGGSLADRFHLVTMDTRGHGESDRPTTMEAYADGASYADDIAAVLSASALTRPTLVGWSVGGIAALDYLAAYGASAVSSLYLVAAGNTLGTARAATHFGAAAAAHVSSAFSPDLRTQLLGVLRLQQAVVLRDLPIEEFGEFVLQAAASSSIARAGTLARVVDHEATLRSLTLPIGMAHGTHDAILTMQSSRDAQRFAPHATLSVYEGAGHGPHLEDPDRFAAELAAFVDATPR
jgi:non-heme chloroperoxidase